ncbi:MAG: leucine--tRNA ligase [Bacteroidetes bacterium]|nr:MAG: leucine--tRNA ligase [Bacteroidota bacterium]
MQYRPRAIEKKWKQFWEEREVYKVSNDSPLPKYYVLDMFPYPSGSGLHVGHPLGYIASDIFARYKRLQGFNVLHPMGYDAFGLPAEQYALQTGVHPAVSTEQNIRRYRAQLENLGFSYDWNREIRTCDPKYYKWTQWIFLQLFKHWYDTEKDTARPIEELIAVFEKEGNAGVQAAHSQEFTFSAEEWKAMSPKQRDDVLMNYRLAYRKVTYVNWCPALGTVLANDEVKDGVSERGGHPVERKPMLQWSLRITAYAERLLRDLDELDWSEAMKKMQSNWIGRSEGAQMWFELVGHDEKIEIYTTRPDTIFGATFMVLAPEHELVERITTPEQKAEVERYLAYVKARSERERMAEKTVTGAFTGAYARNPFTEQNIPVWISEYVLKDYGTGAIMAVPADDERDRRFAEKFQLPIVEIIDKSMYPGATIEDKVGRMINSGFLDGMEVPEAIEAILQEIEKRGLGHRKVNYKLRDAIYSRQRYWGEPFPIVYDPEGVAHPLDEKDLPLELPPLDDFKPSPDGQSPLARATDWVNLPNGWRRETDTMPGFAGSSWYFLRYMDPHNDQAFAAPEAIQYWRDVDLYIGGTEHAVGHLMYSRFWHKFLYDKGLVPTKEPFRKLINQGMIQGIIENIFLHKASGKFYSADLAGQFDPEELAAIPVLIDFVSDYGSESSHLTREGIEKFKAWRPEFKDAEFVFGKDPDKFFTRSEVGKMSKSKFNVINPDDVVEQYGADCFRMFEMFLGPIEQSKPWDTKGIEGVSKFLRRLWGLFWSENGELLLNDEAPTRAEMKVLHTCIKRITEDIERFSLNTCISTFMSTVNELRDLKCHKKAVLEPFTILLAPFAPYLAEEFWHLLGHEGSVHAEARFPVFDPQWLVEDSVTYPVCINGKKRATADFPADAPKEDLEKAALALESVQKWTQGKTVRKVIVVPKRMINIVVS